ncbi:NAD-P-binding protein [Epithele typhae]|uniref:NAD-P-binding protein n=1 Tax=Epithele typhae TaxID=378194 RepID=UPI002008A695|nr:NAD-P-binding protein [Epithele typhae]KAH9925896.1 NAD-P-binding protein [Epithele typhae]
MSSKPLVLVLGATGFTGGSIVQGLLQAGTFNVAAMIRSESLSKPQTEALRTAGVEIRTGDIYDGVEKLKQTLEGVEIVISSVVAYCISDQKDLIRAAKEVGVKRVIPCDFASPGAKGVREIHDRKLAIREYVLELGVPHTFIDVGWWMQLILPPPARSAVPAAQKPMYNTEYNKGTSPMLLTNLHHIGCWVARIVRCRGSYPRTLNRAAIVWEDIKTQKEMFTIADRVEGEGEAFASSRVYATGDEIRAKREDAMAAAAAAPKDSNLQRSALVLFHRAGYRVSMHVPEENTLENTKRLGYLDVRELYPDMLKYTLEDFAREFYAMENPGTVRVRD